MNPQTFTEERVIATKKWREYAKAAKETNLHVYKDLKKVYNQIKNGRKIIDIHQVIAKGGIRRSTGHPKLAIALATNKFVWACYTNNGNIAYTNGSWWGDQSRNAKREDVIAKGLPKWNSEDYFKKGRIPGSGWQRMELKAPVPLIPPQYLPKKITKDLYILWEVDEWTMTPPTDPWLLKRITANIFVVLAAWNLTPLEKMVMKGRMI